MEIRPIRINKISFPIEKRVLKKSKEMGKSAEMVYEPKSTNPLFPKKWTNVIIITKDRGERKNNGGEEKGLGRE